MQGETSGRANEHASRPSVNRRARSRAGERALTLGARAGLFEVDGASPRTRAPLRARFLEVTMRSKALGANRAWIVAFLVTAISMIACGASSAPSGDQPASGDAGPADANVVDATTTGGDGSVFAVPDGAPPNQDAATVVPTPDPDYLWYRLDETTGTAVKDSTSNHFDIDVPGVSWNDGANFDGTACGETSVDSRFRLPPVTITVWLTATERTDGTRLLDALQPLPANALSDDVPGIGGYGIGLNVWSDGSGGSALAVEGVSPCTTAGLCAANKTQNAVASAADGGLACTTATSCRQGFVAGTEYFLAVTVDEAVDAGASTDGGPPPQAKVYVDGTLFDDDAAYVPPAEPQQPLYLGCCNLDMGYGSERFFEGRMRDLRVYKRRLDAPEFQQLYTNGPAATSPASPVDAGISLPPQ
jgi:hypothetical protein